MKILIVRFSAIGDIVLTSPVIRCLKEQQQAEIHFVTKSAFAAIPAFNPAVSKVFALGKAQPNGYPSVVNHESFTGLCDLLKKEKYDYVIDLHHNLRTLRLKLVLGVPSFSFDKLNFEKWLLVNTGINHLPDRHIVHRYMDTVRPLGVQYDGKGLDFFLPPAAKVEVDQFLAENHPELLNQPFIALVIGATHFTKRLPEDKIAAICRTLQQPVVLLGGKAEVAAGNLITTAGGTHVINMCGLLSLFGSAEIVRRSAGVISHDTGLMHIAAALGKKIVAVWGNTVPEFGMYPLFPDGHASFLNVEVDDLSCRPCSKIGYSKCPKGHFKCMKNIDVEQIRLGILT